MNLSLMMIGAHDGSKQENLIQAGCRVGKILLIEPVPYLFERLKNRFGSNPQILFRNSCVSNFDGQVIFNAPLPSANSIVPYGDQLGSLLEKHAINHDPRLEGHIEKITVASNSFATILSEENIHSINILFCDTEGMDITILETFPFDKVCPKQIIFEFKHADGTFRIGKKLGSFLIKLSDLGYGISVLDVENLLAEHTSFDGTGLDYKNICAPSPPPAPNLKNKIKRLLKRVLR